MSKWLAVVSGVIGFSCSMSFALSSVTGADLNQSLQAAGFPFSLDVVAVVGSTKRLYKPTYFAYEIRNDMRLDENELKCLQTAVDEMKKVNWTAVGIAQTGLPIKLQFYPNHRISAYTTVEKHGLEPIGFTVAAVFDYHCSFMPAAEIQDRLGREYVGSLKTLREAGYFSPEEKRAILDATSK